MAQTLGAAPLIAAFGGSAEGISLAPQDFFYYTGTGASAQLERGAVHQHDGLGHLVL